MRELWTPAISLVFLVMNINFYDTSSDKERKNERKKKSTQNVVINISVYKKQDLYLYYNTFSCIVSYSWKKIKLKKSQFTQKGYSFHFINWLQMHCNCLYGNFDGTKKKLSTSTTSFQFQLISSFFFIVTWFVEGGKSSFIQTIKWITKLTENDMCC